MSKLGLDRSNSDWMERQQPKRERRSEDSSGSRAYSPEEISAVFRRASEIQADSESAGLDGLSEEELADIATETGIAPRHMRTALAELDRSEANPAPLFLGGPTTIDEYRIVDGVLDDDAWSTVVSELRLLFGDEGDERRHGQTREWAISEWGFERVRVTVSSVQGRTRVRLVHRLSDWAWAFHGGIMGGAIGLATVLFVFLHFGALIESGIAAVVLALSHGLAGWTYGMFARNEAKKSREAIRTIEELVVAA